MCLFFTKLQCMLFLFRCAGWVAQECDWEADQALTVSRELVGEKFYTADWSFLSCFCLYIVIAEILLVDDGATWCQYSPRLIWRSCRSLAVVFGLGE